MLLCAAALVTRAEGIEVRAARLAPSEEGLALDADFNFALSPRLRDALDNGVALYFVVEFELMRPRWWWFDEKTVAKRMQLRLSYHPLSRQYGLSTGMLQQQFHTLDDALHLLQHVRHWLVVERGAMLPETDYDAAVRMRLDLGLLPKPFQVSAMTTRELHLESDWLRFPFRTPAAAPAPVETREFTESGAQ
jgi:hypothetical protein